MPVPATASDYLVLVHKSGLVERQALETYLTQLDQAGVRPTEPGPLASLMVRDGLLTAFQAEQLLRGKSHGFLLGKYRILEPLGSGGMATVYLCQHLRMGRPVALKVLPPDRAEEPETLSRFLREAQAVAALDHPNIVRAYDVDVYHKVYFLVMEFIDGTNLQDLVMRHGRLDILRAAHYIQQSAEGLQHAHLARLVHRDIKPANLLLSRSGHIKILDMGLARFFDERGGVITKEHDVTIVGTADYLSPEQGRASSEVDIRSDIYSLGATCYFLLLGHAPFHEGNLNQKLIWHQMRTPTPVHEVRPEVPAELSALVAQMMAKDARARPQTPAEVVAALAPFLTEPIAPPSPQELPPLPQVLHGRPGAAPLGSPVGTSASSSSATPRVGLSSSVTGLGRQEPAKGGSASATVRAGQTATPPPEKAAQADRQRQETEGKVVSRPPPLSPSSASRTEPRDALWALLTEEPLGEALADQTAPAASQSASVTGNLRSPRLPTSGTRLGRQGQKRFLKIGLPWWYAAGLVLVACMFGGGIWWSVSQKQPRVVKLAAPRTPVQLQAVSQPTGEVELVWEYPFEQQAGDTPITGFKIERSSQPRSGYSLLDFTDANVTRYRDRSSRPGTPSYYRVCATSAGEDSLFSTIASPPPSFPNGFKPASDAKKVPLPSGLSLNGASIAGSFLRLTDGGNNQARSAFYLTRVDVRSFSTTFRFLLDKPMAEGFTFCIQSIEPNQVGGGGEGLGYQKIGKSVAIKFDLFNNKGEGPNSTGLYKGGVAPTKDGSIDLANTGIDLHSKRLYEVKLDYDGKELQLLILDVADPNKKFSHTFAVNIPQTVGDNLAYVGFTGSTGGMGAVQDIHSWTWTPGKMP